MAGRHVAAVFVTAALVAGGVVIGSPPAAQANPGPAQQRASTDVTADALPTVQIDGIVWSQALIGNTVYAGGSFTHARPPGTAIGDPHRVVANNLISFDVTTGLQNTSFKPNLNGQVLVVARSHDGKTIYVGGTFTTANGLPRRNIAAYDTATGQVVTAFHPSIDGGVRAIAPSNDDQTVYVGGGFGAVNGVTRNRLAAFNATTGALTAWAPSAGDNRVNALAVSPDGTKVIVGGAFTKMNGVADGGLVALSTVNGSLQTYPVAGIVHDSGSSAAILSLSIGSDNSTLVGSGYSFHVGGNLEGVFTANANTGNLIWIEDCHGDSYDATMANGRVYVVSHEHFCSNVGGFPDTSPRAAWYRTTAFTANATGTVAHNTEVPYPDWYGRPSPSQLNWYPYLAIGTASGAAQAAWTVVANSQYVVEGGEFPVVNSTPQQGLVRFGIPSVATNKQGPRVGAANWVPKLTVLSPTSTRISILGNNDRDDQDLTYTFQRLDNGASTPQVINTQTVVSRFWDEPTVGFTDTGLTPGARYNYRVKVSDPTLNTVASNYVPVTMPTSGSVSAYEADVLNDGAQDYWRLGETSGSNSADTAGFSPLIDSSHGITLRAPGAIIGDANTAATFDGVTATMGSTRSIVGRDTFTAEVWIKTRSKGGKIIGFGNASTGLSRDWDRNVYMDGSGHLLFGVNPGKITAISSGSAYNDGRWHYVVAELSGTGMALYVDGVAVASNPTVTQAQTYSGYWRVGGDNMTTSWPGFTSKYFNGYIDEPAIYDTALSPAQIQQHYLDSGRASHPFDLPTAPRSVTATPGNTRALVRWLAPTWPGSSPTTGYDVQYSANAGATWTSGPVGFHSRTATAEYVNNLTNGTAYRFRVAAITADGTGPYSIASAAVRPVADPSVILVSKSVTIKKGASTTLSEHLKDKVTSAPIVGVMIEVYKRANSTKPWALVRTFTTSSTGGAALVVIGTATTQYYWRFPGTPTHARVGAPVQTVTVD